MPISQTLHQRLGNVAKKLKMILQSLANYLKRARKDDGFADTERQPQRSAEAGSNDLRISFEIEGTPPSPQMIKVTANQPVTISRLEYLLPDERCVVSEKYSLKGESIAVPLSRESIDQLYNAPRPAGSTYESSVKLRVTVSGGGRARAYTFQAHVTAIVAGSAVYRKMIGSKDFVSGA